jgi:hypothetical protein
VKVAELQQHLTDLARFLKATGGSKVGDELAAAAKGLEPFRNATIKEFADFLARAEGYRARDEVPLTPPQGARTGAKSAGSKPRPTDPDVAAVAAETKKLFDCAADPSVTVEQIETLAQRLNELKKPGLLTVAEAIGLKGMGSKNKGPIIESIRQRLLGVKGAAIRSKLTGRPGEGNSTPMTAEEPLTVS